MLYDVQAASACGIRTVAVRSGGFADALLIDAGAIAFYDDVADILAQFEKSPPEPLTYRRRSRTNRVRDESP